jgi:HSP20 family protein
MLMRTDPFRELDQLTQRMLGTAARPSVMQMDAYRDGDDFLVHFDLPGVEPGSIDLDVEQNVLTVRAARKAPFSDNADVIAAERPVGAFSRQLFLGEGLDLDRIDASYQSGVLSLKIPVAASAKPRKIQVSSGGNEPRAIKA